MRQLDKRNQEIMSLKEKILQLEGKVPLGQKNEAIEAIEENPYDSRASKRNMSDTSRTRNWWACKRKEIAQNCEGVFEQEGEGAESEEQGSKPSFGKGMFGKLAGGLKMKKRVSEATEAY